MQEASYLYRIKIYSVQNSVDRITYTCQQHRSLKLISVTLTEYIQGAKMYRYWPIFDLLVLATVTATGKCPASCQCPSVYVVSCDSAALRNVPSDRYVFETLCE